MGSRRYFFGDLFKSKIYAGVTPGLYDPNVFGEKLRDRSPNGWLEPEFLDFVEGVRGILRNGDGSKNGGGEEGEKDGENGKGENEDTTENDLKRAEKEGGDLRGRLLRKQQREYLRKGDRVPRSKGH